MYLSKLKLKTIGLAIFVITFLFTSHAKSLDKFDRADPISDYFAGILSFNGTGLEGIETAFSIFAA